MYGCGDFIKDKLCMSRHKKTCSIRYRNANVIKMQNELDEMMLKLDNLHLEIDSPMKEFCKKYN